MDGSGADQRLCATFNTLWIGSRTRPHLCAYIQPVLDWKRCRPTSLCVRSTLFGLDVVQTNVFVRTWNPFLDWKRYRPTSLCLHSTRGADQRFCAYIEHSLYWKRCRLISLCDIQHSLDWKRCRPTSLCLHPTLFGLEVMQTNVVCLHSTLFGLEAVQTNLFVFFLNHLWIGTVTDQRLHAYIQHFFCDFRPKTDSILYIYCNYSNASGTEKPALSLSSSSSSS